jgi:DNA-binding transcriptional regulator YiaG
VRFEDILEVLPFDDIVRLYPTLHEAGESRFVDVYDERAARNRIEGDSRLHTIRVRAGLSQSELARRSGVTLRSVQMYEQRHKDLGKAAVSSVLALARTLGCRIEDLLEP